MSRIHSNGEYTGDWLVIGWHWTRSITWNWGLYWDIRSKKFYFSRQDNMWKEPMKIFCIFFGHLFHPENIHPVTGFCKCDRCGVFKKAA